ITGHRPLLIATRFTALAISAAPLNSRHPTAMHLGAEFATRLPAEIGHMGGGKLAGCFQGPSGRAWFNGISLTRHPEVADCEPPHDRMRAFDRDLIRGGHYGQRSCEPRLKAEHMAAPTVACDVKILLANPEPSTHGTLHRSLTLRQTSCATLKSRSIDGGRLTLGQDVCLTTRPPGAASGATITCMLGGRSRSDSFSLRRETEAHGSLRAEAAARERPEAAEDGRRPTPAMEDDKPAARGAAACARPAATGCERPAVAIGAPSLRAGASARPVAAAADGESAVAACGRALAAERARS